MWGIPTWLRLVILPLTHTAHIRIILVICIASLLNIRVHHHKLIILGNPCWLWYIVCLKLHDFLEVQSQRENTVSVFTLAIEDRWNFFIKFLFDCHRHVFGHINRSWTTFRKMFIPSPDIKYLRLLCVTDPVLFIRDRLGDIGIFNGQSTDVWITVVKFIETPFKLVEIHCLILLLKFLFLFEIDVIDYVFLNCEVFWIFRWCNIHVFDHKHVALLLYDVLDIYHF